MRRFLIFMLASLSVARPIPSSASDFKESEVRRMSRNYAACVVLERHKTAAKAIIAAADNDEILRKYPRLIDSDCLASTAGSVTMMFKADNYRYALAEALVNSDFARSGPTSFDDRLPLAHLSLPLDEDLQKAVAATADQHKREELANDFKETYYVAWLSRYGECIVRADPVASRNWLLTIPDGPEESSRIDAMRAAFTACLKGGTSKFTRSALRGTVAINYYRLAMAKPLPAAADAK